MMKKTLLLISIMVVANLPMPAQITHNLELKVYAGRTLPHRNGMQHLAHNTLGGELNYYFVRNSDNFYDLKYKSPQQGIGISYNYLGDPNVLGSAVSAYSFMDFKLYNSKIFRLGLRINAGGAYLTRKYDINYNPENIAISTNICFYFGANINLAFRLPSGFELKLMPAFMHYSNGSVKKPNLGLNQVVLSLAVSKNISEKNETRTRNDYQDELSPHEAWIMGTCSTSDEFSVGYNGRGGGFICSTSAIGYCYQYGKIGKVGASFDMLYNENMKYYYYPDERGLVELYNKFSDIIKFGASIGHQLVYRRLELVTYLGVYVYNKVWAYDWIYTRFGVRYYATNFMFLNLSLHANGFKARYIECGLGFSCRKWKK